MEKETERRAGETATSLKIDAESPATLRDQFLVLALHDLRTPLATMRLAIDAWRKGVREKGETPLCDILSRNLAKAEFRAEELGWIHLLTSLTIAEQRSPTDLNRLTQEAASSSLIQGLALGIKLEYDLAALPPILGDEVRLRQMLTLVLAHTLERLEAGHCVRLETKSSDGGIVLRIRDNSAVQTPSLYDVLDGLAAGRVSPFARVGLYVAFLIAQAHGGFWRAGTSNGTGSMIWLWLPAVDDAGKDTM